MFDLDSEAIRRNLTEAMAWCSSQKIIPRAEETPEIKRRRELAEEAYKLLRHAFLTSRRWWARMLHLNVTKSAKWQRGMELLRQADPGSIRPLGGQLRSPELKPAGSIGEISADREREEQVLSVISRRSELLRAHGQQVLPSPDREMKSGRFLLYVPEENVADGASQVISEGFFDLYDAPPWDIWIAYSNPTLLCWVPPQLVALAQRGIDVNAVDCIHWLE